MYDNQGAAHRNYPVGGAYLKLIRARAHSDLDDGDLNIDFLTEEEPILVVDVNVDAGKPRDVLRRNAQFSQE
ncbi:MAG: hypothetical protein RL205_958 [Actinomycetota bacterium]